MSLACIAAGAYPDFCSMKHKLGLLLLLLAPVVRRVNNAIHWINRYPADSMVCFVNTYPLDSELSGV